MNQYRDVGYRRVPIRLDAPVTATSRVRAPMARGDVLDRELAAVGIESKSIQRTLAPTGLRGLHPRPDVRFVIEPGDRDLVARLPGSGQRAGEVVGQLGS